MVLTKHEHVLHSCCQTEPSVFITVLLVRSSNCTHGLRHSQVSNSAILVSAASSCIRNNFKISDLFKFLIDLK